MGKRINIPALRFPEFSGEWELNKIKHLFSLISGQHLNPDEYTTSPVNLVPYFTGPSDFTNNENETTKWALKDGKEAIQGDILFTVKGSGLGAMMFLNLPRVVIGRQLMSIRSNKASTSLLFHYLGNHKQYFESLGKGNMIPGLARNDILDMKICFPNLSEQQKIASFLTSIDDRLNQLKKKKTQLEQYKKGIMQKIFSQEHRFKDDEGKDFPDWDVKYGNEIFESISNKNHNSDLPILAITQEFGAIPRELIEYQITVTDKSIESYKVVEIGDYIISLRSFQGGIEYSGYKGICSPAYIILRAFISIHKGFFKYYFKTDYYINQLNKKLEGIRDGKMISYKYFSDIELPFPSLPEQTKIANLLSAIDIKINHTITLIEKTQQWKKGLLQQMFC